MSEPAPPFELTEHARTVLVERNIDPGWVERVLTQPMRVEPDRAGPLQHALGPIPERDGRILRVVYNPFVQPPLVITVFFDRREKRSS
jgi:hypothetical protein